VIDHNRVDCEAMCGSLADFAKSNYELFECAICKPLPLDMAKRCYVTDF